jgi:hypothetical protein
VTDPAAAASAAAWWQRNRDLCRNLGYTALAIHAGDINPHDGLLALGAGMSELWASADGVERDRDESIEALADRFDSMARVLKAVAKTGQPDRRHYGPRTPAMARAGPNRGECAPQEGARLMADLTWRCDICGTPVAGGTGRILSQLAESPPTP